MKLPDIIAAAGGIAAGRPETVTVIRDGKPLKVNSLAKDFELQDGDTVYVDRAPHVLHLRRGDALRRLPGDPA